MPPPVGTLCAQPAKSAEFTRIQGAGILLNSECLDSPWILPRGSLDHYVSSGHGLSLLDVVHVTASQSSPAFRTA